MQGGGGAALDSPHPPTCTVIMLVGQTSSDAINRYLAVRPRPGCVALFAGELVRPAQLAAVAPNER